MTKKIGGLGRGLEALFPGFDEEMSAGSVIKADIRDIDTNPAQPRKSFTQETLQELAYSIRQHGIVQPLLVKKNGNRYIIIAGERRFRAARMAGLSDIPVLVTQRDEQEMAEVALIENIQREDLNPVEEATAISFLMKHHDLTQEEVAGRIGKSRPAVANSLRLLSLPKSLLFLLEEGILSAGHGKILAGIPDSAIQLRLAEKTQAEGWSVHRLEEEAKGGRAKKNCAKEKELSNELRDAQDTIRQRYSAKVEIMGTEKRGKIIFSYFTGEELEHLYQRLTGGS